VNQVTKEKLKELYELAVSADVLVKGNSRGRKRKAETQLMAEATKRPRLLKKR
jgi:hypothetical protein